MQKGSFYVVMAAVLYSLQPVFVKLAYNEVPGPLMVSMRFLGMLLVFVPVAFHFKKTIRAEAGELKKFLVPAITVFLSMALFTISIYFTENATLTALLVKSNAIFIPAIGAFLFIEERKVLLSKKFLTGMLVAGAGVAGVITAGKELSLAFGFGIALLLLSQIAWSAYSISIKSLIKKKSRLAVLSLIYPLGFLFALPLGAYDVFIVRSSFNQLFLAVPIASGIVVATAHIMQFKAIEAKGLIVTNSFSLVSPLIAGIASAILFGEMLSMAQMLFGALVLFGSFLIISCKCDIRTSD